VRDAFGEEEVPDLGVGDFPESVVRATDGDDGPVDGPTCGVEEGEDGEVFCTLLGENGLGVEVALDYVAEAGEVDSSVGVFYAFGLCRSLFPHKHPISTYNIS